MTEVTEDDRRYAARVCRALSLDSTESGACQREDIITIALAETRERTASKLGDLAMLYSKTHARKQELEAELKARDATIDRLLVELSDTQRASETAEQTAEYYAMADDQSGSRP